jgi:hypothetical protein
VQVAVKDAKAVVSAMSELLTQAKGRPQEQKQGEQMLVVNRRVVLADEESEERRQVQARATEFLRQALRHENGGRGDRNGRDDLINQAIEALEWEGRLDKP